MQDKTAYNRLYLLSAIWILYGFYRLLRAMIIVYVYAQHGQLGQMPSPNTPEMLVFGAFSIAIGFGLLFRSKFMSLELLSLPLALLAYSLIWSILKVNFLEQFLIIDYLALLMIIPTQLSVKQLQISPAIKEWSMASILFWVMIEIFLFNGVIYLMV
jgi:hypothetical protein